MSNISIRNFAILLLEKLLGGIHFYFLFIFFLFFFNEITIVYLLFSINSTTIHQTLLVHFYRVRCINTVIVFPRAS